MIQNDAKAKSVAISTFASSFARERRAIACRISSNEREHTDKSSSPSRVSETPRWPRRKSAMPSCRSSWLIRWLSAGCDMPRALAALVKFRAHPAAAKISSAVSEMRILPFGLSMSFMLIFNLHRRDPPAEYKRAES